MDLLRELQVVTLRERARLGVEDCLRERAPLDLGFRPQPARVGKGLSKVEHARMRIERLAEVRRAASVVRDGDEHLRAPRRDLVLDLAACRCSCGWR